MDKKQKRAIRLKIADLLDSPNPDHAEIERLGKLLNTDEGTRKRNAPFIKRKNGFEPKIQVHEYLDLRNNHFTLLDICELYGMQYQELRNELRVLRFRGLLEKGATKKSEKKLLWLNKETYLKYRKLGWDDGKISEHFNVTRNTITRFKKDNNIKLSTRGRTLTNPITLESYLKLEKQGLNQNQICEELKVSRNTLYKYRKKWRVN